MAARGYWLAFQSVQEGVGRVLRGDNPGQVTDEEHGAWYRELFAPSVASGILKPADLAGYRNSQVYIRKSMHVPLNRDAVRDAMPAFFDLLREEAHPAVRLGFAISFRMFLRSCMLTPPVRERTSWPAPRDNARRATSSTGGTHLTTAVCGRDALTTSSGYPMLRATMSKRPATCLS